MSINRKTDPRGVDYVIDLLQEYSYNAFTVGSSWTEYESYDRAYSNETEDGLVPEVYTSNKEYKDVFFDDNFNVTSFWLVGNTRTVIDDEDLYETDVSVVFQAKLNKLYPSISHRADEEFHRQVQEVLKENPWSYEISGFVTGIDNVYSGFNTSKIQWTDMHERHVVKFDFTVQYQYDCGSTIPFNCGSACPSLCQQIESNSAASIVSCIESSTPPKENDIKALLCTPISEWLEMTIDTRISAFTGVNSFNFYADRCHVTVDKGDGSDLVYLSTGLNESPVLTYTTPGIYDIRIKVNGSGKVNFDGRFSDAKKILAVSNMGTNIYSGVNLFFNCINAVFTATDYLNVIANSGPLFYGCTLLVVPPKIQRTENNLLSSCFRSTSLDADLGYLDIRATTTMPDFAKFVTTWSQANYEATWLGWLRWDTNTNAPAVGWTLRSNVVFDGGNSTVSVGSDAALARQYCIDILNWTITDGGVV